MDLAIQEGLKHGPPYVGAVIVDPKSKKVLARAHDERTTHPLGHATMNAVAKIADLQKNTYKESTVTGKTSMGRPS